MCGEAEERGEKGGVRNTPPIDGLVMGHTKCVCWNVSVGSCKGVDGGDGCPPPPSPQVFRCLLPGGGLKYW